MTDVSDVDISVNKFQKATALEELSKYSKVLIDSPDQATQPGTMVDLR